MKKMWLKGAEDNTDLYVAFCGKFYCSAEQELPFVISGCSWFRIFLNGMFLTEGPYRYDDAHPVSETISRPVRRGENIIFAIVHSVGVPTRMLMNTAPFFRVKPRSLKSAGSVPD